MQTQPEARVGHGTLESSPTDDDSPTAVPSDTGIATAAARTSTPAARAVDATPLCLLAFAVVTFMFSLINAGGVSQSVLPVVISTGLIFAGFTQLVGGLIQVSNGDTLNGAMFSTFASLWLLLAAYLEWFSADVPSAQRGEATALLLYTFAVVAATFLLASLRTNRATVLALGNLVVTLIVLGAGNGGAHTVLIRIGGITGILLAVQALHLAAAGLSRHSYGRQVVPLGDLPSREEQPG
ncbi:acetate uptake transporter [Actinomycetospora sp. TBRC 11914]|uniref:acetate uptake transporter n=1 Tax=Actinomycetospora sp. TBRC 11914 TaxID=2729387 RepID=UPI00145E31C6|nr:acetate uptake transporter [Actinomycetospora sp. TBRC 11914]NMO89336.1 acetate uptake transporter [Actinomycetospora sp. TBRC 11914]